MKPLVAIPVRNRLDLTRPLVEALEKDGESVLVMDNGSDDGTAEWALGEGTARPSTRQYLRAHGMGLHEMWNHAVGQARMRDAHLVLLNNDLQLDGKPDWIGRLCAPFSGKEEWDALCPNYDGSPVVSWKPVVRLRGVSKCRTDGSGGLAGFAFALSSRFLKTGYRFPEDMRWWYGDNDLVMTLDAQERPYGMVAGVGVTHIGGGSQTAKAHDLSAQQEADLATFEKKWSILL